MVLFVKIKQFFVTIQDGGKPGVKNCVKLACKQLFTPDFTSEEFPMLLVRQSRTRRCPRPEQLQFFQKLYFILKLHSPGFPNLIH